jgi:hypothetical protein
MKRSYENKKNMLEYIQNEKQTLDTLFLAHQQPEPIFHPQILLQLFVKGYDQTIFEILIKLHELLEIETSVAK